MAYVDLRERGGGERRRGGGGSGQAFVGESRVPLALGLTILLPALVASYAALARAPGLWLALACWLPPAALLLWAAWRPRGTRGPSGFGAEKSLLLALRDSGGAITPVGAALETPLTVGEAEGMLLKLANEGHLRVESHDGALYYVLPADRPPSGPLGRS
ncbi:hypothetical protein GBA65_08585 [Rubrobacter marinus]|uniref:Uncharacterized protein n=1 Tax=Rubrobacter marinus TaxID=2653852 RepID=A0A6G8PWK2_9ACTN|nr:hypothetical protein [Rubrobacter marinus]QIN78566.1 hypothetical protein GBA65_08585 [Rubrobacter marinus]